MATTLRIGSGLVLIFATAALATSAPGCATSTSGVAVRALQSAGPTAFLCLADASQGSLEQIALPLDKCPATRSSDGSVPHLYALTTQPIRGEVAVIDLTTDANALIDSDPATPGTNFLPIGGTPTGIVSTPGGMASFVTVADPGFEGIFALPSDMVRQAAPRLSDWPSCSLPSAPSHVVLVLDPANDEGATRPSCDAAYGAADSSPGCGPDGIAHCHGDLAIDAAAAGAPGRYKLIVSLPKAGGIAVIDAQALLDQEAGAFASCRIERFLPLEVQLAHAPPVLPETKESCVEAEVQQGGAVGLVPMPAALAVADGDGGVTRLYVADGSAPAIHRIDMPTPCEPAEVEPLLPSSIEDPARLVTTSTVAVSPLTLDLKRYLYAIDDVDGSIMVFDVSDGARSRKPLERSHPEWNPFQPADRIRFGAPPRQLVLVRHSADLIDDATGASLPVRCDPNANATSPAADYQTNDDLSAGAGPRALRGVFAFAVLASGNIVVIDIDDFDGPCRGPVDHLPLLGCSDETKGLTGASGEYTCNVLSRHEPRSAGFLMYRENVVNSQPGLQTLPLLFDVSGTVLPASSADNPRMRATIPAAGSSTTLTLPVGSRLESVDPNSGKLLIANEPVDDQHALLMNYEDPRAHIVAQAWSVSYEGALPGFAGHFGQLTQNGSGFELRDPATRFCSLGVEGKSAVADRLIEEEGASQSDAEAAALDLADYVQIISDTPVASDKYWHEQDACSFSACDQTYGTSINPLPARDLRIDVAKNDVLELQARAGSVPAPALKCCFPNLVQFRVRGGGQWIVTGAQVGFLHHVEADGDGVCRPKCDPMLARLVGRVRATETDEPVSDGDPRAFRNPFFRFAIHGGSKVERDVRFELATQAPFAPLQLALQSSDKASDVQPTSATFLKTTGELVVSDGSLQGLSFIDIASLARSRQFQ